MRSRTKLLGSFVLLAACAVNPATGEREFSLVSESQEIQMGREADPQIVAQFGVVDDAGLQSYVSGIGMRIAQVAERPNLPWSFKVVDDPIVNAFALPGGFVYVSRGILAYFESEAELAGVLGHEVGHVTARHSASQVSRQQLQQLGLGVGMIFSETIREYGQLASAGLQLMNLRYSRGDESEADRLGLRYIGRLGYDPDAMIGVFQMLASVSSSAEGGRVPEWQLTHPYPENREQAMRQIMEENDISREGRTAHDEYLAQIDGLTYGENPREGYFKDARFVHPDLEMELTFPAGWRGINQRSVVAAIAPREDAVMTMELVPDGGAPEAELREFLSQEGISAGPARREGSGGVEVARADFDATTEEGVLSGEVAFIRYDGNLYRLLGYSTQAAWRSHASAIASSISSFKPLTDRAILAVEPWRLEIVQLPQAMSLQSYVSRNAGPIPIEELARLNRVEPGDVLPAGTRIKRVVGSARP
ncbi:MAG: M48 family metalloprotease [Gemmatimonadales bacterium]